MNDLCIMVAPNGARRTRMDHPALPITPKEIAGTAALCMAAGAGALHLHVRDEAERHSLDATAYREAIAAVEAAAPGMVIQPTTEAAGIFEVEEQIAAVRALRPACVSLSIAELMREGRNKASEFLRWASETGIAIQFILYSAADIALLGDLRRKGSLHLNDLPRLLLVAGRYSATLDSDVDELDALYRALLAERFDQEAVWMVCAFGRGEMRCLERAIDLGGHVRVGFENAIVDADGRPAVDNAQRVAMVAAIARRYGRPLADHARARDILAVRHSRPLLDA